eukprot:7169740-Lingulodinium_polyedra.AAC.1
MRSNRLVVAAAVCESYASQTPCEHQFWVFAWRVRRMRFASRCGGEQHSSSTQAAPKQQSSNTQAVRKKHPDNTEAAPEQRPSST